MLVTARPSLAPGVFAATAAPLFVFLSSWLLVPWAGGSETLSPLVEASGTFGPLVIISGMVELAFLSMMLCHVSVGREVPITVLLGVATLPWTVGLLGTEVMVGRTVAELSTLDASDARTTLALGVGEAMASRVLGAWTSAALLGGLGLGLHLARASGEVTRVSRRGQGGLLFGGLTAFALAAIAVLGALEAYQLFGLLTHLEQVPVAERTQLLVRALDEVARLQPIRWASTGLLVALALGSVWQSRRHTQAEHGWAESGILLAAVAALLVLDGHPLRSALQGARAVGLVPLLVPEGFQPLRTPLASEPHALTARATPEGITLANGLYLPWSTPARALASTFTTALHSEDMEAAPTGLTVEPRLSLLADARLSGPALERLIEASTHAGVHSVELVGQQPNAAAPPLMARLEERLPFFSLLAARPGTQRLLLPAALPSTTVPSWRAHFGKNGQLHLSPSQGGESLTLSLRASPAEVPVVLAGTFVGLELSRDVSLERLSAAVDVLGLAGASPVVVLGSAVRQAPPALGGTKTALAPELLHSVAQAQLLALQALRHEQASRLQGLEVHASVLPAATHSSQMNSATPRMNPTPSTSIMNSPSRLEDGDSFGTISGFRGFTPPVVRVTALTGRSSSSATVEASRSSSPSRARASTRFMWSM